MKENLRETEYRFDLVPEQERLACLNWEYEREYRLYESEPPLKPWSELKGQEKQAAFEHVNVYNYVETRAAVSWATLSESRTKLTDPSFRFYRKVVTLPPILVEWGRTDSTLLKGFERLISAWLKEQRQTDPSASFFKGKIRLGPPPNVLSLLADLAVYRLRRRMKWSALKISKELQDFEKLEGVSPRLIRGKVFVGNLERTCHRVEQQLFGE